MDPGRLWDASGRPLDGRSCPGSVRPLAGLDALGPRHRGAPARVSRLCTTSQKMLKIFKVNVTILPQPKPPRQYQ